MPHLDPSREPSRLAAAGAFTAKLLLVRHGRTALNADGVRVGRQDPPLDEVGVAQAAELAERLATIALDAVYASPLRRARQTAEAIAARHPIEVEVDPDLIEFDFGDLSGTSRSTHHLRLRRDYVTTRVPGGESLTDLWVRVGRFADALPTRVASGATVAVVAHRRTNQMLATALRGGDFAAALAADDYRPATGSVVEVAVGVTVDVTVES